MNEQDLLKLRHLGTIHKECMNIVQTLLESSVEITTADLEELIKGKTLQYGMTSPFFNYRGYPAFSCISVNEVALHGIPGDRKIHPGDVISVDVGIMCPDTGLMVDAARTFVVPGKENYAGHTLVSAAHDVLKTCIDQCVGGVNTIKISIAGQSVINRYPGIFPVGGYPGHYLDKFVLHKGPGIYFYAGPSQTAVLKSGDLFTIEPILSNCPGDTHLGENGWDIILNDTKKYAAHVEDTMFIHQDGSVEVLT